MKSKEKYITAAVIVLFTLGLCALVYSSAELKDSGDSNKNTRPTVTTVTSGAPEDNSGAIENVTLTPNPVVDNQKGFDSDTPTPTPKQIQSVSPTPTIDPIVGDKKKFKDLRIGEVGKKNNTYVGLQYVKSMPYLPTALGKETVQDGNEVIIAFFEFYNDSEEAKYYHDDDVTCYADGVQVFEVETYIIARIDGIRENSAVLLDNSFQLLIPIDFEVPKGWKELKFFYKSDCVWTVSATEVNSKEFVDSPLISVEKEIPLTETDSIIFSNGYSVQFKGAEFYLEKNSFSNDNYVVFKFTITNTGDTPLITDSMGINMHAYCENYYINDVDYFLNDKINGYVNLTGVDRIESGMSANVYIAFECLKKAGKYYLVYDDGESSYRKHYCGYVYTELK